MKRRITGYGIALAIGITGAGLGTAGFAASAAPPAGTTSTVTTTAATRWTFRARATRPSTPPTRAARRPPLVAPPRRPS